MKFRPCIDIHNGKIKQIIGGSLKDLNNEVIENFISDQDGAYYANLYKKNKLFGGHIILLNADTSEYYNESKKQAILALNTFPGGMQIGGGINADNAKEYLEAGASHVIVTSFVFSNGEISFKNLEKLVEKVGKEHIVLDLSCRKKGKDYYIVTDRWQRFTSVKLDICTLSMLAKYCDEFLIHAVDVEGKSNGIEVELVRLIGQWNEIPLTYAGGIRSIDDLKILKELGKNEIDVTIGSALDLFGGPLSFDSVMSYINIS